MLYVFKDDIEFKREQTKNAKHRKSETRFSKELVGNADLYKFKAYT